MEGRVDEVPGDWEVLTEQKLGDVVKIDPENAKLTVRQYLKKWGLTGQFPKFPKKFLNTRVNNLQPDIVVKAPGGRKLAWDLTSQPTPEHLAKTLFYAEVIGREEGGLIRVSEDYWRQ